MTSLTDIDKNCSSADDVEHLRVWGTSGIASRQLGTDREPRTASDTLPTFTMKRRGRCSVRSMKRLVVVLVACVASLVVGTVAPAANASPSKLSALVLSINQMPTGWRVYKSAVGGPFGCAAHVLEPKGITRTAQANVAFENGDDIPTVDEALATFTSVKTGYEKIDADLTACKYFSGEVGGTHITGTVASISFSHYGDTSAAFAVRFTLSDTTFHEDLLIVRKASIVMGIDEVNLAAVNVRQFQGFVKKALAKLP